MLTKPFDLDAFVEAVGQLLTPPAQPGIAIRGQKCVGFSPRWLREALFKAPRLDFIGTTGPGIDFRQGK